MTDKPKIYCFSNVHGGREGPAYAMAEDGTVLGLHICSNEACIPHDLGVNEGARRDRHKTYAEHYQDGYEMEFIRASDVKNHEGLSHAFELNREMAKVAEAAGAN